MTKTQILLQEIRNAPRITLEVIEKISEVEAEANYLLELSRKELNPRKAEKYWHNGDLLLERLTQCLVN